MTLTNNSTTDADIHTFQKSSAAVTHQWKLTNAMTTDPVTAASIEVTVAAGATGTVARELRPSSPGGGGGGGGGTPSYTVTFNSNGGSAVTSQSVTYNNKVTKPADPTKEGFTFAGWYTDSALTNAYDFSKNVTGGFTLYAKWTEKVVTPKPFPFVDVSQNAWYYSDVKTAWEQGLVDGTSATTFAPNDNLTYAEAVKLAACMHQLYTTGKVTLENRENGPWYQTYVDYAKANGIISGDFDWNAPATRAEYMAILAKALPDEAYEVINTIADGAIPDVPMTHPQAAAIYRLYRAGIVQGLDGAHNCNPGAYITRAEVAAILTRMMNPDARIMFSI